MTKTITLSIIGIIAAVAVIVIFQVAKKPSSPSQSETPTDQVSTTTTTPTGKKMAFSEFVKQGGSYQCTVNQYIDAGMSQTTQGTVFIDSGKVRGDFATKIQGMSIDTSFIVRDGFAYTWTSMTSMGFKSPVTVGANASGSTGATSGTYTWNAQQIGDYDCKPWTTDASKFTLPTSITFK